MMVSEPGEVHEPDPATDPELRPPVEAPWRSLEPLALLVNLVPDLARTARGAWPLLLAIVLGGGMRGAVDLPFVFLFFVMSVSRTVTHLLTLRYRLHRGRLELRSGLIGRQHRIIDPARIQNVEVVQNLFHRMFGLAELRVETAGGELEVEGQLSGLMLADAESLRESLAGHASPAHTAAATEANRELVTRLGPLELVGYGVSSGRVGAAALIVGVVMEVLTQVQPRAAEAAGRVPPLTLLGLALLAMAGAFVVSALGAMFSGWDYRLTRSPLGIRTESGLTTRRRVEIPWEKVQLVRAEEPILRQVLGYGTLFVETAATGVPTEAGPAASETSVPMVAADELGSVAQVVLPRLDVDPWSPSLNRAAPHALGRAVISSVLRWAIWLSALALVFRSPWAWALMPVGPLFAWLDWRRQRWWVSDAVIVSQMGFPTRRTWIIDRRKLQSVRRTQGPLQRLYGLGRVEAWVAGSLVVLPDLREADATRVFEELLRRP